MTERRTQPRTPQPPTRRDAIATRDRLLEAASIIFARQGYRDTSVRDICAEAEANVSAVRHYFGGKEALYRAVVLGAFQSMRARQPLPDFALMNTPEEVLRSWIHFYSRLILIHKAGHAVAGRLLAHELRQPTGALDDLVRMVLRPIRDALEKAIGAMLGPADAPRHRLRYANMIQGIILSQDFGEAVFARLGASPVRSEAEVHDFAERVTAFAVGGIRAACEDAMGGQDGEGRS